MPMDVPLANTSKLEHISKNKRSMYEQVYIFMETNVSNGVGEHLVTLAYLSALTGSICRSSF